MLNVQNTDSSLKICRREIADPGPRKARAVKRVVSPQRKKLISFCAETAHATASLGIACVRDRRLIRSLSAFSLAKEDQVNENA
jgi:hypothetical protein